MINKRIAIILMTFVLMLSTAVAIDTAVAKQNPQIVLDSNVGTIGQSITIAGQDFAKNSKVIIEFFEFEIIADKSGDFSGKATVPTGLTAGTYDVVAADENCNTAKTTFVVEPSITLKPNLASCGSEIAVYGCGFSEDPAGDGLVMLFGKENVKLEHISNGELKGTFTATFIVPDALPGPYTVVVSSVKDPEVCAYTTFNVCALVVTPENPFGALIAVFACAAAVFVFFKKYKKPAP